VINAVITADNHYAVYSTSGSQINYVGGNEIWAGGSEGRYNWSVAESWSFQTGSEFYIAAWSDNSVAQGVLAQIFTAGGKSLHSGNAAWQVFASGVEAGNGTLHPTAGWITDQVNFADTNGAWENPFVGGGNGLRPWSKIAGVTDDAKWSWWNNPDKENPLMGGTGAGELLIFRVAVPTPGTGVIATAGLVIAMRRRRR
jgi:hypothetical protein